MNIRLEYPELLVRSSVWYRPDKQLILLLKWHIGLLLLQIIGCTPKTFSFVAPKNILIVGTGPSVSRLDSSLASRYDCLIAINYALRHPAFITADHSQNLFWFCADPFRIMEKDLIDKVSKANRFIRLYYPVSPTNILPVLVRPKLRKCISVIKPKTFLSRYRDLFLNGFPQSSYSSSSTAFLEACSRVISGKSNCVPGSDYTSAFTAAIFFASMGAKNIDLIGCDLNTSRDLLFNDLGQAGFDNNKGRALVHELKSMMSKHGINFSNLSWL